MCFISFLGFDDMHNRKETFPTLKSICTSLFKSLQIIAMVLYSLNKPLYEVAISPFNGYSQGSNHSDHNVCGM